MHSAPTLHITPSNSVTLRPTHVKMNMNVAKLLAYDLSGELPVVYICICMTCHVMSCDVM